SPKSPTAPGIAPGLTSSENRGFADETRAKWKVAISSRLIADHMRRAPMNAPSGGLRRELLALVDCLLDGADHVERRFRQVIVFSLAQSFESADGIGKLDEHAGRAGEHFGHMEGL